MAEAEDAELPRGPRGIEVGAQPEHLRPLVAGHRVVDGHAQHRVRADQPNDLEEEQASQLIRLPLVPREQPVEPIVVLLAGEARGQQ